MSNELKQMFSAISEHYDKVNRMISLGTDVKWRAMTARECLGKNNARILDVATGTADLAISIANEAKKLDKKVNITGLDFSPEMLKVAKRKVREQGLTNIKLVEGDALRSGFASASFDAITSGFALRNIDDLEKFLSESYRLLKPDGTIAFLDAARSDSALGNIMKLYYYTVIPAIGAMYNTDAYMWFVSSVWKFDKKNLVRLTKRAGFTDVKVKNMVLGTVYIITARKPRGKGK